MSKRTTMIKVRLTNPDLENLEKVKRAMVLDNDASAIALGLSMAANVVDSFKPEDYEYVRHLMAGL